MTVKEDPVVDEIFRLGINMPNINRTLNGDIKAKSVTIDGVMVGTVKADTVQLAKHADFNGELCCGGIAIDEGAKIKASFMFSII